MMTSIQNLMIRLRSDERGLTAVEYAVLGGIVVAAIVGIGTAFDADLTAAFGNLFKTTPAGG
ncbi:Flp family type IVb pilin [Novosphingobium sp. P6W]|uniref:Flp family type IVb pilin n=1 Tax=Novosphingobium sp. P6W TaxID=1609758 RepID=UPI0005C31A15|nr:Flp family type IVb pilin [Novosphingobium sp. P6W]AXB79235.1 Flp family type IVb pilin [Novosphingobium sp. P6W]KIS31874.1 pilus assembly protein [Novosphingobium sp. P6W]